MTLFTHLAHGFIGLATAASVAAGPMVLAHGNEKKAENEHVKTSASISAGASADITPSGHVTVRGATVTGVSSTTVTATTVWGGTTLTWTVLADSSAEVIGKNGNDKRDAISLADIKVGDKVNFQGVLTAGTGLTVDARVIRVLSIVRPSPQKDIFQGTLHSITATTLPASLTLKSGSKLYTVVVPANTPVLKSNFTTTTLATFVIGDTVRVYGSVDANSATTLNALIVRDASR